MIDSRSDFSANSRLISISVIAVFIGLLSTVSIMAEAHPLQSVGSRIIKLA